MRTTVSSPPASNIDNSARDALEPHPSLNLMPMRLDPAIAISTVREMAGPARPERIKDHGSRFGGNGNRGPARWRKET